MIELLTQVRRDTGITGQQLFAPIETTTEHEFIVPEGVEFIHGVAIGPGNGYPGGGLSWRNNIPVTPGETLRVVTGLRKDAVTVNYSGVFRGATTLLYAFGSVANSTAGGKGGKAANAINDGGGDGGYVSQGTGTCGGGGAGGYTGTGGVGVTSGNAGDGSGGGGGGGTTFKNSGGGTSVAVGGGTQPYGLGESGMGGKTGSANTIRGGTGSLVYPDEYGYYGGGNARTGCVRLIWGNGRAFPSTKTWNL